MGLSLSCFVDLDKAAAVRPSEESSTVAEEGKERFETKMAKKNLQEGAILVVPHFPLNARPGLL